MSYERATKIRQMIAVKSQEIINDVMSQIGFVSSITRKRCQMVLDLCDDLVGEMEQGDYTTPFESEEDE